MNSDRALPLWHKASFYLFLLASLVITLFPFVWMVSTSFKSPGEIFSQTPTIIPTQPTLEHYDHLLAVANLARSLWNSLIFALGSTVLSIFCNALAAYAFAKLNFRGREKLFTLLMLTMMVPGQVTMMPVFLILKSLGMLNTFAGLIIPGIASVFAIFMLRQFMTDIPEEILEAARIDGCSEFRIFWEIMIPLCRPILATLAIFQFIGAWNEFFWPLIIMLREDKQTLPVALANLNGQYNTDWGLLMAGAVLVVIPVILVFLLAQKHYIKGIAAGAVKD
ncbi:MAG TPA: carbohydrate ABC transporter permease [Candidatus Ozemobacteraceae bacterium]|nr:carbohydrate ABC transporter permease [Candidatus Ozemobacteraceae bacterium]